jgi:hypothetical protein
MLARLGTYDLGYEEALSDLLEMVGDFVVVGGGPTGPGTPAVAFQVVGVLQRGERQSKQVHGRVIRAQNAGEAPFFSVGPAPNTGFYLPEADFEGARWMGPRDATLEVRLGALTLWITHGKRLPDPGAEE